MVDYSKWSSLDDSGDEDETEQRAPRVTRLENPSSITFGGGKSGAKGAKPIEVTTVLPPKPPSQKKPAAPLPVESIKSLTAKDPPSSTPSQVPAPQDKGGSLASSYNKWDKILAECSDSDEEGQPGDEDEDDEGGKFVEEEGDEVEEGGGGGGPALNSSSNTSSASNNTTTSKSSPSRASVEHGLDLEEDSKLWRNGSKGALVVVRRIEDAAAAAGAGEAAVIEAAVVEAAAEATQAATAAAAVAAAAATEPAASDTPKDESGSIPSLSPSSSSSSPSSAASSSASSSSSSVPVSASSSSSSFGSSIYAPGSYVWSQTRNEANLCVVVPPLTKAKDVVVNATKWNLEVKVKGQVVVGGRLAYPLQVEAEGPVFSGAPDTATGASAAAAGDDDDRGRRGGGGGLLQSGGLGQSPASEGTGAAAELDWEVKDLIRPRLVAAVATTTTTTTTQQQEQQQQEQQENVQQQEDPQRVVCVALPKLAPAPGVVVWWQGVFTGPNHAAAKCDQNDMPDRVSGAQGQTLFQKNWSEAHAMFKEKVKGIKKTVVDTSGNDSDSDDGSCSACGEGGCGGDGGAATHKTSS